VLYNNKVIYSVKTQNILVSNTINLATIFSPIPETKYVQRVCTLWVPIPFTGHLEIMLFTGHFEMTSKQYGTQWCAHSLNVHCFRNCPDDILVTQNMSPDF
jgi:hypothetical protein